MPPENLLDWVALHLLPRLGPIALRRALERFGDPGEIAFRVSPSALAGLPRVGPETVSGILKARKGLRRRAEAEIRECERRRIRLVLHDDPDYPAALVELPDAPLLLYIRGNLRQDVVRVGIVGSRRATAYGRRVAAGMAASLVVRGIEVVSGGARGIDTCAHKGALESGGRTVVVLGSGMAHAYPPENRDLFERIAGQGALVSEFPVGFPSKPENFPRRNRLVSGLSAAVVVVEATARSGSLITAGHALEQGREVMAVPGPVSSEQSEGCHRLIQEGARLVQRVDDIAEELPPVYTPAIGPGPEPEGPGAPDAAGLSPDEVEILRLFDDPEPVHGDLLAERAPFGIARFQTGLLGLELRGFVEQLPGRYYLLRPREPRSS
jgi:DNA processing protein